jgi:hypothetical protein
LDILTACIAVDVEGRGNSTEWTCVIDSTVEETPSALALADIEASWRRARCLRFGDSALVRIGAIVANAVPNALFDSVREPSVCVGLPGWLPDDDRPDVIAVAAASNDVAAIGRLLGALDVNTACFYGKNVPDSVIRRPFECSLLDVAVGSGSVEVTKYLFEFHSAKPTQETLKQALSTGRFELIKLVRDRLPESDRRVLGDRVELMGVAAEFHQPEVLGWLLRDATVFDRELLGVFTLERKLADSLEIAFASGFHPWWSRTRDAALKWRASSHLEFVSAPEGFWSEGGWWTDVAGVVTALPARGFRTPAGWAQPGRTLTNWVHRFIWAWDGRWTKVMSDALLGRKAEVKAVVFPPGVTAIGWEALEGFEILESVVFPAGCTAFRTMGWFEVMRPWGALCCDAFWDCRSLKSISIPAGCKATGDRTFYGCSSLESVIIPVGCTTIGRECFAGCESLTTVQIPKSCEWVGDGAFFESGLNQVVIPDGCRIDWEAFTCCRFLKTVVIGTGCRSIPRGAFSFCFALGSVTLPSTVRSIDAWAFQDCHSLTTIAVPPGCRLDRNAFFGATTRVTVTRGKPHGIFVTLLRSVWFFVWP